MVPRLGGTRRLTTSFLTPHAARANSPISAAARTMAASTDAAGVVADRQREADQGRTRRLPAPRRRCSAIADR